MCTIFLDEAAAAIFLIEVKVADSIQMLVTIYRALL
jgi:hypothetical protein